MGTTTTDLSHLEAHTAHNYAPLPVVIAEGEGAWVTDVDGRRYLDALAGYSALNFGHRHPRLIDAVSRQLQRVTLTSRAFHHDQLAPFCRELAALVDGATRATSAPTPMEVVLPMNTGAEGVETAIKAVRRWGYRVKGVPDERATIVVAGGNFHGRTTTIIGFSSDDDARADFGPFTPGFVSVPFGDTDALAAAIDDTTVAVLIEPVQGEAGVIVPDPTYLLQVRETCTANDVLLVADEIQSGLGRTGRTLAIEHADVSPDVVILGKALGGGILPVSAVVASRRIMDVFTPGSHGSTFGGNPLACAVGREVVAMLSEGDYQARATSLGARLRSGLDALDTDRIVAVRSLGLWAGVELAEGIPAKRVCLGMLERGVLAKDTHETTVRLAPPLVVTEREVDLLVETLGEAVATA
jgi:ornithine--oxo-acid transaminase